MNKINKIPKILLLFLLLSGSTVVVKAQKAELYRAVATKSDEGLRAEVAARKIFTALQNNDQAVLSATFPSKETYQKMILAFGFPTEAEQNQQYSKLNRLYEQERRRVMRNFTAIQAILKSQSPLTFQKFVFLQKNDVKLTGGRGAAVLTDKEGKSHSLVFFKFYEFEGAWYVTNKLSWHH